MTALFDKVGRLCLTWPRSVLVLFGVLALGAIPLVGRLSLEADVRNMLPGDMAQAMERHNRLFGTSDLALLLVQTAQGSKDDLIAFGAALQQRLVASALIRRVEFGYDTTLLATLGEVALDYAPLFVRPEQLEDFERLLTPEGIKAQIRKTLLDLSLPGSSPRERLLLEDPLQLRTFALARLSALRGSFRFDAFSPYFLSQDGKALLIRVEGRASVHDMAGVKATVELLQQVTAELLALPAFQGLTLQTTGGYFFAAESERIIRRDIMRNLNLSAILICLFTAWAFRRWDVVLYVQIPTLLSLWLALGVFALVHPHLNALALGCAAGLIGIGDDYTIHVLTHWFEARGLGRPKKEALRAIVRETGGGLLLAALATGAAFVAFLWAEQPFLQDMGFLAALGIFLCFLLCVTFLPALLVCFPERRHPLRPRALGIPFLMTHTLRASPLVLGLSLALCLGALAALLWWPPGFETDLRNIHAVDSPTLQAQAKLAAIFGGSQEPLLLMIEGATEEHVMQDLHRLEPALMAMVADGVLAAVTSPSMLYPDRAAPNGGAAAFATARPRGTRHSTHDKPGGGRLRCHGPARLSDQGPARPHSADAPGPGIIQGVGFRRAATSFPRPGCHWCRGAGGPVPRQRPLDLRRAPYCLAAPHAAPRRARDARIADGALYHLLRLCGPYWRGFSPHYTAGYRGDCRAGCPAVSPPAQYLSGPPAGRVWNPVDRRTLCAVRLETQFYEYCHPADAAGSWH